LGRKAGDLYRGHFKATKMGKGDCAERGDGKTSGRTEEFDQKVKEKEGGTSA